MSNTPAPGSWNDTENDSDGLNLLGLTIGCGTVTLLIFAICMAIWVVG
jgi:hypothetical protein